MSVAAQSGFVFPHRFRRLALIRQRHSQAVVRLNGVGPAFEGLPEILNSGHRVLPRQFIEKKAPQEH